MRLIRNLFVLVLALSLGLMPPAFSQTYPTTNPTYLPAAILGATTLSAAGTVVYQVNGIGTVLVRVTGSGTGIAATMQVATERAGTLNWTTVSVQPLGSVGASRTAITATGLYRVTVPGASQIRFNLTAVTGSIAISMSGNPGLAVVQGEPLRRITYSAIITGLAPAASATDFLTLTGSATKTVRLQRVSCSGTSTAAATAVVQAVTRSTANSAGTATAPAGVPHDTLSPAASATVAAYTANPTLGTIVGSGIRTGNISTVTVASTAVPARPLEWNFGRDSAEEIVLRGIAQVFALNGNGASFSAGAALNCDLQWTEE